MSIYSEKYASYPGGFYGFDVTYPWSDPNTPAPYYQSYPTTGEASIDPSIFQIIRRNDEWSFGANLSFLTNSPDGVSSVSPSWEVVQNRYKKNVDTLAKINALYQMCPLNSSFESTGFYTSQYSPDQIAYSIDQGQFFLRDWDYNNLVLLPRFWFVYMDGSTYRGVESYYNDIKQYADNYNGYVASIDILPYYGGVNTESENSRQNTFPFAPYIQFAGTIPRLRRGDFYSGGSNKNIFKDNYVSGVFLTTPYSSGSHVLHLFESPNLDNRTNQFVIGSQGKTAIIPFSANLLVRLDNMPQYDIKYGLTLEDAKTIIDRLGYNWAKSLNAAQHSKTGSWCTDPDLRCAVIDPETNEVSTEVLEGVYISDYAVHNPNSNYNWGSGDPELDGPTMIQVAENTNPVQTTVEPADEIDIIQPVVATLGGSNIWLMDKATVDNFFKWLWDPDGTHVQDLLQGIFLFGNNPMDSLISLRMYPLDLSQYLTYEYRTICFGRMPVDWAQFPTVPRVTSSNVIVLDMGSFYFNDANMFNDFRDYEPYSDYSLYIPFCGIVPLSAVECINTTVSLKMIIDLCTGSCTAVVYTNGVPYKFLNGMIGIETPISGRNLSDYANTVLSAAMGGAGAGGFMGNKASKAAKAGPYGDTADSWKSAAASAHGANGAIDMVNAEGFANAAMFGEVISSPAVMGLAFGVAGAAIGGAAAALTNAPAVENVGSNTPATSLAKPLYPYFIVRRSDCWIPENFAALYGRPLQQGGVVGDFPGFSTFGNIKVDNIEYATSAEKVLISELLTKGVFI